jgi:hypothetical protein
MSDIERIRDRVRRGQFDMTMHAMEEMAEDSLDIIDVEQAILNGQIVATEKDDPRGTKYIIEGLAKNGRTIVLAVGRFTTVGDYLIITVYAL